MNKNYFLIFLGILILAFCSQVSAQTATTDVVYLKNGRTVRGKLLKIKAGKKLKLRTESGALYNLRFAEIDRLEKVEATIENLAELPTEPARKVRFTNIIELAYAGGKVNQKVDDIELDFTQHQSTARAQMINGVQFGQRFTAGFGTGLDFYMNGEFLAVPLFLDLRGTTKATGPIKPEVLFAAGYSIDPKEMNKGPFASGGLGLKIKSYNNTALHLSLNYHYQQFARKEDTYKINPSVPSNQPGHYVPVTLNINTTYSQFEVRIGHSF